MKHYLPIALLLFSTTTFASEYYKRAIWECGTNKEITAINIERPNETTSLFFSGAFIKINGSIHKAEMTEKNQWTWHTNVKHQFTIRERSDGSFVGNENIPCKLTETLAMKK